ncbi:MAG: hypothetical protein GX974_02770 [Clostridiales bacterium]|nr:hypothetical protein [Clostridiales bacterium]
MKWAFEVDIEWSDNNLNKASIYSMKGKLCRVYSESPLKVERNGIEVSLTTIDENIIEFITEAGNTYTIYIE